jgi:hypothetical protein
MRVALTVPVIALIFTAYLYSSPGASAQSSPDSVATHAGLNLTTENSELPTAPEPSLLAFAEAPSPSGQSSAPRLMVPTIPLGQPGPPLTLHDRFVLEARTTFGPAAFILPAVDAAIIMADPPQGYPREWSDGGGAFGRNYGAEFAENTASGLTHFTIAAIIREDPRYYPATSTNYGARALHALAFTIVNRSDSGHRTLAISNFAGAAAGGFVGMSYEPVGFDDFTHAYQRSAVEFTTFASHNLLAEFAPEIGLGLHKLHFPDRIANSFLPADRRTSHP